MSAANPAAGRSDPPGPSARYARYARPAPAGPATQECSGEACVTCSDSAVEVRVMHLLDGDLAIVDTGAGQEEVSVALVRAEVGDTVLVHAREAIAVVRV